MQEYYFLYAIAAVWIVIAIFQDLRTTEISNWLNFSLIAFVLSYRAFYAISVKEPLFFVYGLLGVILFVVLGYALYYGKIIGGGDVKLLMGLGGIWPYQGLFDYFYMGIGFIFLLFVTGAVWTLFYSMFLVRKNVKEFVREFKKESIRNKNFSYFVVFLVLILIILFIYYQTNYLLWLVLLFIFLPLLYIYVKAVEKSCMIKLVSPKDLIVGDWLLKNVRIGKKTITKSVHGLSWEEIKLLKKAKKKVWIKGGAPFTPAFLIALLIMIIILRYSSYFSF